MAAGASRTRAHNLPRRTRRIDGFCYSAAMGDLLGYARVSTGDQSPDLQLDALTAAGCSRVFVERASGALAEFERDVLRERTAAGLAAARARGRTGGRPPWPAS